VTVTHVTSGGTFSAADNLIVHFTRTGDQPATDLVTDLTPQLGGVLDTNSFAINESEGTAVASATTTDIWSTTGNTVHVTGTTTITSFGTAPQVGAWRKVIFDGALTLTHGANLNLPGSANITTAANDFAYVYADTTTLFRVQYFKVDGTSVIAAGGGLVLQAVNMTVAEATGTTTIPFDDTLPANTEGTEIGTQSITMADDTNQVLIHGAIQVGYGTADAGLVVVLFRGTTAIAARAVRNTIDTATLRGASIAFAVLDSPATAGAVTYSLRIGSRTGTWFTGTEASSGADFGDTADDGLVLLEISA